MANATSRHHYRKRNLKLRFVEMYNLIYYYWVSIARKKNSDYKFYATGWVLIAQIIHFSLISVLLRELGLNIFIHLSDTYLFNKLLLMPFGLIWYIILFRYYKKKHNEIEQKYKEDKVVTITKTIIVMSLFVMPLVIAIFIVNKYEFIV